jgi:hypothetical protein
MLVRPYAASREIHVVSHPLATFRPKRRMRHLISNKVMSSVWTTAVLGPAQFVVRDTNYVVGHMPLIEIRM